MNERMSERTNDIKALYGIVIILNSYKNGMLNNKRNEIKKNE